MNNDFLDDMIDPSQIPGAEESADQEFVPDTTGFPAAGHELSGKYRASIGVDPQAKAATLDMASKTGLAPDVVERNKDAVQAQLEEPDWSQLDPSVIRALDTVEEAIPLTKGDDTIQNVPARLQKINQFRYKDPEDNTQVDSGLTAAKKSVQNIPENLRLGALATFQAIDAYSAKQHGEVMALNFMDEAKIQYGVLAGETDEIRRKEGFERAGIDPDSNEAQAISELAKNLSIKNAKQNPSYVSRQKIVQDLIDAERQKLGENAPVVEPWTLGWVVSGIADSLARLAPAAVAGVAAGPSVGWSIFSGQVFGAEYAAAKAEGLDDDRAMERGVVKTAFELIPEQKGVEGLIQAGKMIADSIAVRIGTGALKEGTWETVTQISNEIYDAVRDGKPVTWGEYWNRLGQAFTLGTGGGATMTAPVAAYSYYEETNSAKQKATAQKEALQGLVDDAKKSSTAGIAPGKYEEILRAIDPEGSAASVFIPAEKFVEYYQLQNIDPREMAGKHGSLEQFEEALVTNGDVEIPIASFVAHIARDQDGKAPWELLDVVRLSPQAHSFAEASAIAEDAQLAEKEIRRLDSQKKDAEFQDQQVREIYENVKAQLLQNKKTSETEAATNAMLFARRTEALAKRAGVSPMDVFKRREIQIIPPGGKAMEVKRSAEQPKPAPAPQKTATPVSPIFETKPTATGKRELVNTPKGTQAEVEFRVTDLSGLSLSNDPGYPGQFQPRQRKDSTASDQQVDEIAAKLDPSQLDSSAQAGLGAPITATHNGLNFVLSGNGRMMALKRAFEKYPESQQRYIDYWAARGIDLKPGQVVHRHVTSAMDEAALRAFSIEANDPITATMDSAEEAKANQDLLTRDVMALYAPADLTSQANAPFVRAIIAKLPTTRLKQFVGEYGLHSDGVIRIQNAILAKAYGGTPYSDNILNRMMMATDDNAKSLSGALLDVSPIWSDLREQVSDGILPKNMDLTEDLIVAIETVSTARDQGKSLNDMVRQTGLFGDMKPAVEQLIRSFFAENERGDIGRAKGRPKIAAMLTEYVTQAQARRTDQASMFDIDSRPPEEMIRDIRVKADEMPAQSYNQETAENFDALRKWMPMDYASRMERAKQWAYGVDEITDAAFIFEYAKSGKPIAMRVMHGTTHDISSFVTRSSKNEMYAPDLGFGIYGTTSPKDASANYADHAGPDLVAKIGQLHDRKMADSGTDWGNRDERDRLKQEAIDEISGGAPNVIPLIVRMKNPLVIGSRDWRDGSFDGDETVFEIEYNEDGEAEDGLATNLLYVHLPAAVSQMTGVSLSKAREAIDYSTIEESGIIDGRRVPAGILHKKMKDATFNIEDPETGNIISPEIVRLALELAGFDGIVDKSVSDKFSNMAGVGHGTVHVVAFKPNQVRSENAAFMPDMADSDMILSQGPTLDMFGSPQAQVSEPAQGLFQADERTGAGGANGQHSFQAEDSPLFKKRTKEEVGVVTDAQAAAALAKDATSVKILAKGNRVENGQLVGARLNINVLKNTGVPVVSIHKATNKDGYKKNKGFYRGEVLTYQPVITMRNVFMNVDQKAREDIASGRASKSPMASVDGEYVEVAEHNYDGVEFRFNPHREHLFVDRHGRILKAAEEVTIYSDHVFARGKIEYYTEKEVPTKAGQAQSIAILFDPAVSEENLKRFFQPARDPDTMDMFGGGDGSIPDMFGGPTQQEIEDAAAKKADKPKKYIGTRESNADIFSVDPRKNADLTAPWIPLRDRLAGLAEEFYKLGGVHSRDAKYKDQLLTKVEVILGGINNAIETGADLMDMPPMELAVAFADRAEAKLKKIIDARAAMEARAPELEKFKAEKAERMKREGDLSKQLSADQIAKRMGLNMAGMAYAESVGIDWRPELERSFEKYRLKRNAAGIFDTSQITSLTDLGSNQDSDSGSWYLYSEDMEKVSRGVYITPARMGRIALFEEKHFGSQRGWEAFRAEAAKREKQFNQGAPVEIEPGFEEPPAPELVSYPEPTQAEIEILGKMRYSKDLSPEEKIVEENMRRWIAKDPEAAARAYWALPEAKKKRDGKPDTLVINTDIARDLSPEYAFNKRSKGMYAGAVHEPLSWLMKKIYKDALANDSIKEILFTAGGGGSGKDSALEEAYPAALKNADLLYDGTFSKQETAEGLIEQALKAGKDLTVAMIVRDPYQAIVNGIIPRAKRTGRTVAMPHAFDAHDNAIKVFGDASLKYEDKVLFVLVDNTGKPGEQSLVTLDYPLNVNYNDYKERALSALEEMKDELARYPGLYRGLARGSSLQGQDKGGAGSNTRIDGPQPAKPEGGGARGSSGGRPAEGLAQGTERLEPAKTEAEYRDRAESGQYGPVFNALYSAASSVGAFRSATSTSKDIKEIVGELGMGYAVHEGQGKIPESYKTQKDKNKWKTAKVIQIRRGEANDLVASIFDADSDRPFIEIGHENAKRGGELGRLYQAFGDWALNNNKTIRPDPRGLSEINQIRRTEQMISSMLRTGQSRQWEPDPTQFIGFLPEDMLDSDMLEEAKQKYWGSTVAQNVNAGYDLTAARIANLAISSTVMASRRVPDAFEKNAISPKGKVVDISRVGQQVRGEGDSTLSDETEASRIADAGVGGSTLKRMLLVASSMGWNHQRRVEDLGEIGLQAAHSIPSEPAEGLFSGVAKKFSGVDRILRKTTAPFSRDFYQSEPKGPVINKRSPAEKLADVAKQYFHSGEQRAAIRMTDSRAIIETFRRADKSTIPHEFAHLFLEDMIFYADSSQEIQDDLTKILSWMGIDSVEKMGVEHHEAFARAFEAYLRTGKAPSNELRPAFSRFKAWLTSIYKNIKAYLDGVELNEDLIAVMDRMLATDEQIEALKKQGEFNTSLADVSGLMTKEERAAYIKAAEMARIEAEEAITKRTMMDVEREKKSWWIAERNALEKEMLDEMSKQPVYAVQDFLKGAGNARLSRDAVIEIAGSEGAKRLSFLTQKEDGAHPDLVAEAFGFSSGDQMLQEIMAAPPKTKTAKERAKYEMVLRHGDVLKDGSIGEETARLMHTHAREKFLDMEIKMLARKSNRPPAPSAMAKEFAVKTISGKPVQDAIKASKYLAAEGRAAAAYVRAIAKADFDSAIDQKRIQIINGFMYRESLKAKDEVVSAQEYVKRLLKAIDGLKIDREYAEQIEQILEQFEFKKITNKEAGRRKSLAAFITAQEEAGNEVVIADEVRNAAFRIHYKDLTMEQMRSVISSLKNIEHLGRLKHRLLTDQKKREFNAVVNTVVSSIEQNAGKAKKDQVGSKTAAQKVASAVSGFAAEHRKFSNIVRQLDGWKDNGDLWHFLVRPMNAAGDAESVMREKATIDLGHIFKDVLKAGQKNKRVFIQEIGESLTRENMMMIAMHMGTDSSRQRLLDGDGWTMDQAMAIVNRLTKEEMDTVQKVWDYLGQYRDAIGKQQLELTGLEPEWLPAAELVTVHGTYKGGYLPAKYDSDRSTKSMQHEAANDIKSLWRAKIGYPKTRDTFTKTRANEVHGRPLRKDFGVIFQHVTEVTHRLAWENWLRDARKMINDPRVDKAMRAHAGPDLVRQLHKALEDIAAGDLPASTMFEKAASRVRNGATIVALAWRFSTAALQPIGLTQSIVRIGPKYVARGAAHWMGSALKMEHKVAEIMEKSSFLRLRHKTMQREISEIRNRVSGDKSETRTAIEDSYFWLIHRMQMVADVPTWLGAYEKAWDTNPDMDEETAIALADQAVIDAQGAGLIKDLAAIQRGGPLMKLFTNFYSYFSTTYNLSAEAVGRTNFKRPADIAALAADFVLLYTIPAVLGLALRGAFGMDDDEDEDSLAKKLVKEQAMYMMGTMVGLRDMASFMDGFAYSGPAGLRIYSEVGKLAKAADDGELNEKDLKPLNQAAGILFHYPAGQLEKTLSGIDAILSGETKNPGVLMTGYKE